MATRISRYIQTEESDAWREARLRLLQARDTILKLARDRQADADDTEEARKSLAFLDSLLNKI